MIEKFREMRGGIEYDITIGVITTPEEMESEQGTYGKSRLYADTVQGVTEDGFRERWHFLHMELDAIAQLAVGQVDKIKTIWRVHPISPTSRIMLERFEDREVLTNATDLLYFALRLGMDNLIAMLNGLFRDILGFDDKPIYGLVDVIGENGVVTKKIGRLTFTEEQKMEPPIGTYRTKQ